VGGQIGTALQKKFLTLPVGQQLLASRVSASTGRWVLYRRLKSCSVTGSNNHGCQLSSMDVTIVCTGSACTITRTNASASAGTTLTDVQPRAVPGICARPRPDAPAMAATGLRHPALPAQRRLIGRWSTHSRPDTRQVRPVLSPAPAMTHSARSSRPYTLHSLPGPA
jgi:hypothetical protein